jgi:hypothetical protein
VDRQNLFYAGGYVQRPQQLLLDTGYDIRERGYQIRFSFRVWAGIVGDIVVGIYLLPERLNDIVIFWKLFYRGYMKVCLWL